MRVTHCIGFIFIVVIKHPDKNQLRRERAYSSSQFPGYTVCHFREDEAQEFQTASHSTPAVKGREKKHCVHAWPQSGFPLYSPGPQAQGMMLPTVG